MNKGQNSHRQEDDSTSDRLSKSESDPALEKGQSEDPSSESKETADSNHSAAEDACSPPANSVDSAQPKKEDRILVQPETNKQIDAFRKLWRPVDMEKEKKEKSNKRTP